MDLEEHKRKKREYMRKYNATIKGAEYNRKHVKQWRKKNPNISHGKRKNISAGWKDIIVNFLIKRDGLVCGICQQSLVGSKFHIDYITPVALGGQDIMDNVQLAHPKCNLSESNMIRKELYGH